MTTALRRYMRQAVRFRATTRSGRRYLADAIEVDVDALADGEDGLMSPGSWSISRKPAFIPATAPARCRPIRWPHEIAEIAARPSAGRALNVVGLMNVQFAVKDDDIYMLEVNPRASRTVPFVAKATGVPIAKMRAARHGRRKARQVRTCRRLMQPRAP